MAKKAVYNEESISQLKGADRVRLRPAVIFGSDGIEGCEHAVFEILSNSIDEAREGYGKEITVTRFLDGSVEVSITAEVCLWTTTKRKSAGTGSCSSVRCMPAVNIIQTTAEHTSIHSDLTDSDFVPHSMLRSIWMPRCTKTDFAMRYILRRASRQRASKGTVQ